MILTSSVFGMELEQLKHKIIFAPDLVEEISAMGESPDIVIIFMKFEATPNLQENLILLSFYDFHSAHYVEKETANFWRPPGVLSLDNIL